MNEYIAIDNIQAVIDKKRVIPSIVMWNRQEGRPRTNNFDRALKAEVRDALFMLTRQWQMGEFRGDDAGSPIFAKVHMHTTQLNKYRASDHGVQAFETDVPLETKVEQRHLPFLAGNQIISLDIRLLMGRHWLKLLKSPEVQPLRSYFIEAFPVNKPDPDNRDDALITAHQQSWQQFSAAAGRSMDGGALYQYLKSDSAHHAYDLLTDLPVALSTEQETALDETGVKFINWFERLFYQPEEEQNDAWLPEKLEYQFACSAPDQGAEKKLLAEEYYHGHLDWYNFNVDDSDGGLGPIDPESEPDESPGESPDELEDKITYSFFPVPVQFDGMPNTRWWTFEEGKTNFGDINPDTTDLNKLLLIEFGLVYANDWFLVPFTLPAGSIAQVKGLAVTNVFGERIWVKPSGEGSDEDWQRWSMFGLSTQGAEAVPADTSLLLLPSNPKIQEGKPVEEVHLARDEVANMVWGIETQVPLPSGKIKPGREAALELFNHYKRIVEKEGTIISVDPLENEAAIKYQLMNSVPENWIPFIPVHRPGDNREIQLQRASMPRIIEGDPQPLAKIKPRTQLLRHGLNESNPYFLFEEEVPRAGIRVYQSYQRTRWYNGKVYNWLGVRKQTGHGEKSSGLAFDFLASVEKNNI